MSIPADFQAVFTLTAQTALWPNQLQKHFRKLLYVKTSNKLQENPQPLPKTNTAK